MRHQIFSPANMNVCVQLSHMPTPQTHTHSHTHANTHACTHAHACSCVGTSAVHEAPTRQGGHGSPSWKEPSLQQPLAITPAVSGCDALPPPAAVAAAGLFPRPPGLPQPLLAHQVWFEGMEGGGMRLSVQQSSAALFRPAPQPTCGVRVGCGSGEGGWGKRGTPAQQCSPAHNLDQHCACRARPRDPHCMGLIVWDSLFGTAAGWLTASLCRVD